MNITNIIQKTCSGITLLMLLGAAIPITQLLPGSKVSADYPVPTWWGQGAAANSCDPLTYSQHGGSSTSTGLWQGVSACIPQPGTDVTVNFGKGDSQWEWECIEMVERYLYQAFGSYGFTPYAADGAQLVSKYNNSVSFIKPIDVSGGNANHNVPDVGDALSMGIRGATSGAMHAAIVTDVRYRSDLGPGNYDFTVFQQNTSSPTDSTNYMMRNWAITANGYPASTANGWLHIVHSSPLTAIRRVNNTTTNGTIALMAINPQGAVAINGECASGCSSTGGWGSWTTLTPSPATFTGKVAATFDPNHELTLFARDTSGNIWYNSECNSNSNCQSGWTWQGWNEIPGFQTPYDATVFDYDTAGDIEVFANGTDDTLYYNYWQNGAWHGWSHVSDAKAFATNAQVGIYQSSATNVFEKDASGTIWHIWTSYGSPTGWSSWNNDGSVFTTNATPVRYDSAGDLDLFAQSNLNVVGNDPVINGSWAGWSQTSANPSGISFTSMIAGALDAGNTPEIFTRDTSGAIWHQWGGPGAWSSWASLGGGAVTDPAIAAHADNSIDLFIFAYDGPIYVNEQCGTGGAGNCNPAWSGWISLGNIL